MKYKDLREEELKKHIARDFFGMFDAVPLLGNIDFAVKQKPNTASKISKHGTIQATIDTDEYFLWAEAKTKPCEPIEMMTQLIMTIGKARTFETYLPPPYLGCFDYMKIAFVPYYEIQEIFSLNDFNWNVTSSNSGTKEFRLIYEKLNDLIDTKLLIFDFEKHEVDLKTFIKDNFVIGKIGTSKIQITKNNFISVYNKWLTEVKPSIQLNFSWDEARNQGYLDADFYLADLMSEGNKTLGDKLYVLLKETMYKFDKEVKVDGRVTFSEVYFKDDQKAHTQFWAKYERPPREEYREFILDRRDLLVPQDIRERKGSFYTPQIWVEVSQKYLTDVFGENWQEEYFIWDCAAGTGNLLVGLTEKYRIFASTLDKADVAVMHERIEKGANLLKDHVFQFDFLNDDIKKLPERLLKIINSTPEKLIIYINPPYAESTAYGESSKPMTANTTQIFKDYSRIVGAEAMSELFAQFFIKINDKIPNCHLASFSKLKFITSGKFIKFRNIFKGQLKKGFVCEADTFDNVKGKFPIGFLIWDLSKKLQIDQIKTDVIQFSRSTGLTLIGDKHFYSETGHSIASWRSSLYKPKDTPIGYIIIVGPRIQYNNITFITSKPAETVVKKKMVALISENNLLGMCVYNSIRHIITNTWLNDCDQFLHPKQEWETDIIFQTNCLAYTLFHNSNNIQSEHGPNHWIPFSESEVNARTLFDSNFMTDFISGKIKKFLRDSIDFNVEDNSDYHDGLDFSPRATDVFDAGRELWKYYHEQPNCNVNASFYDIREHFQGRDEKGRMNATSNDDRYNMLLAELKLAMKFLAHEIEPKIYEYGFLKE